MVKLLRTVLVLCLLTLVIGGGFLGWIWYELHTPIVHNPDDTVEIARGERLDQILNDLVRHGVIQHALPLRVYMKLRRQELLVQAGNYTFPSPVTPLDVLTRLQQGGDFARLTIIEGWTRWDIANAMVKVPSLHLQNQAEALALLDDVSLIKDLDPRAKNLEGYLFPDTYFVVSNSTAKEIVQHAVNKFKQVYKERIASRAKEMKLSAHNVVTMASIIETEAKLKQERPIIASVIYNRIAKKMPLSMDSTIVYASKLAGAWKNNGIVYKSDVDRKSPYNTRQNVGLPPGPVGSPGASSLEAAVYPAQTTYLFYVRNPDRYDGAHNFYSDARSFDLGVQKLRQWEARQNRH